MAVTAAWLSEQYLSSKTMDLEIAVAGRGNPSIMSVFPAHALVLVSQSSVLANLLSKAKNVEGQMKRLQLKGHYSPRALEYFLRFLYTKQLPKLIPIHHLQELLHIADTFDVDELLTECDKRLRGSLTIGTVCELYEMASTRSLTEMQETCRNFILSHLQSLLASDLHFALRSEQTLTRVIFENSKAVEEFQKQVKTRDGDLLRNAIIRWQKWLFCLKANYVQETELFKCVSERRSSGIWKETSPYKGRSADTSNWIPDLYMDKDLCDVELVTDDEAKFYVHSLVINKQSEVFLSMWKELREQCDMNKTIILRMKIGELDARTAEYMLRFLYSHDMPSEISDSNLRNLLSAAHRLEIKLLETKCIEIMTKKLNLSNVCEVLELSERLDLKPLQETSFKKVVENSDKIFKNYLHFSLSKQTLGKVLSCLNQVVMLKEWTQWRCCLLGVNPNERNIAEMIDSLITEAAENAKFKRSESRSSFIGHGGRGSFLSKKETMDVDEDKAVAKVPEILDKKYTEKSSPNETKARK